MTLQMRDGDLFDAPEHTIVNTVNCHGVMGKGIALQFKRRYPAMFREYIERCMLPTDDPKKVAIGRPYLYEECGRLILNFPTKNHWRFPSKVEYIRAGLAHFSEHYTEWGITSIAFPRLGCENGGLDWETQVRPLMEQYLNPLAIPVAIVTWVSTAERDHVAAPAMQPVVGQHTLPGMPEPLANPASTRRHARKLRARRSTVRASVAGRE